MIPCGVYPLASNAIASPNPLRFWLGKGEYTRLVTPGGVYALGLKTIDAPNRLDG